jgi:hypothetical protein
MNSLIVFLILLLSVVSAKAQAPVCADLFRPLSVLEQVDFETRGLLLGGRTVDAVRAEMGLVRRWKLAMISRRLSSRPVSLSASSGLAGDLHLLFIEPRLTSFDIFRLLRDGDRFVASWAEREILRHGLESVLSSGPAMVGNGRANGDRASERVMGDSGRANVTSGNVRGDVRDLITRAKYAVFARLPARPLFLRDRQISPELLSRVLDHGVTGEFAALERAYGHQREVDYARALQPYVRLVVYALAGYVLQVYQQQQEAARGVQFVNDLATTESNLDALIAELKKSDIARTNP